MPDAESVECGEDAAEERLNDVAEKARGSAHPSVRVLMLYGPRRSCGLLELLLLRRLHAILFCTLLYLILYARPELRANAFRVQYGPQFLFWLGNNVDVDFLLVF